MSVPSRPWPLSPLLSLSTSLPGSKSISMKSSLGLKLLTGGGALISWSWKLLSNTSRVFLPKCLTGLTLTCIKAATPVERLDWPAPATPGRLSPSLPLSSLEKVDVRSGFMMGYSSNQPEEAVGKISGQISRPSFVSVNTKLILSSFSIIW